MWIVIAKNSPDDLSHGRVGSAPFDVFVMAITSPQPFVWQAGSLVTVGLTHLKDPANPFAAENRRVQVTNTAEK